MATSRAAEVDRNISRLRVVRNSHRCSSVFNAPICSLESSYSLTRLNMAAPAQRLRLPDIIPSKFTCSGGIVKTLERRPTLEKDLNEPVFRYTPPQRLQPGLKVHAVTLNSS